MAIIRNIFEDMRSRSQRAVAVEKEEKVAVGDGLRQSCWANMPQELLREVLVRIEASEDTWPPRKNVVACAGVCRNWRVITKEIVKKPEISAQITFPISVKQVFSFSILFYYLFSHLGHAQNHLFIYLCTWFFIFYF
jgi:hypothetical protein